MPLAAVLLGPPGVGKGTQAARLERLIGADHLSTGDMLRHARRQGTGAGKDAARFMDAGELVPDEVILKIVRERLLEHPENSIVFDGFPRTVAQAEGLENALRELSRSLDLVALLEADDGLVADRLAGRRICPRCSAVFHVLVNPPRTAGRCDRCESDLEIRPDDRPETVRRRLQVYHGQTAPLVSYYERGPPGIERVDATASVDQVARTLARLAAARSSAYASERR